MIDLETTGLAPERDRVLQVGVVVIAPDGQVVERWSSLVRPPHWRPLRIGAREIHGIGWWRLRRAPLPRVVYTRLASSVAGAVIVAHNASFDLAFLRRAVDEAGVALVFGPTLCTLDLSRRLDPQRLSSHRLADVCARYGIHHDRPHDALGDAEATAALLPHLLAAHGVGSPDDVAVQTSRSAERRSP